MAVTAAVVSATSVAAPKDAHATPADPTGEYTALDPSRVLDTRVGLGRGGAAAPIGAGQTIDVQISGHGGVPSTGVSAVAVSLTAAEATQPTFVTAWPSGAPRPTTAAINTVGRPTANFLIVKLSADGRLSLYNSVGTVHLIADVVGFVADSSGIAGARFHPVTPTRLVDTRSGFGTTATGIGPGGTLLVRTIGAAGVPADGVTAVALNVTVAAPSAETYVTLHPGGVARPEASNVNVLPHETVAIMVVARVPASGEVALYNFSGEVDVVVDVMGYFDTDRSTEAGRFVAEQPWRVFDSRPLLKSDPGLIGDATILLSQANVNGAKGSDLPPDRVYLMSVYAAAHAGYGYLTAYPSPGPRPPTSNLNYSAHGPVYAAANALIVAASPSVAITNEDGSATVIIDVLGHFTTATTSMS